MTFSGEPRTLQYPLNRTLVLETTTPEGDVVSHPFEWPTSDPDEPVAIALELSLNEFIGISSCVDVGSDIAYGTDALTLWFTWVRSLHPMLCTEMSECIANLLSSQLQQLGDEIIAALAAAYDGTAGSIAPNAVYDASGDDVYRDQGLCNAWLIMVQSLAVAEQQRRENAWDFWANLTQIIRDVAAAIIPVWPTALFVAMGAEFSHALVQLGQQIFKLLPDGVLANTDAQISVACCAYTAMQGATPTPTAFYTALDGCSLSGDAETLRQAIQPLLAEADIDFYMTFIATWSSMFDTVKKLGVGCECDGCVDVTITFPQPVKPQWEVLTPPDFLDILPGVPYETTTDYKLAAAGATAYMVSSAATISGDQDGSGFFLRSTGHTIVDPDIPLDTGYGYKFCGIKLLLPSDCTYDDASCYMRGFSSSWSGSRGLILLDANRSIVGQQVTYTTGVQFPSTPWTQKAWAIAQTANVRELWIWGMRFWNKAFCESNATGIALDNIVFNLS